VTREEAIIKLFGILPNAMTGSRTGSWGLGWASIMLTGGGAL